MSYPRIDTLTPARARALRALRRVYEATQGARGCTTREVMTAAGLASPTTAAYLLAHLERLGYAERYRHPDPSHVEGSGGGTWIPTGYRPARYVPLLDLAALPDPSRAEQRDKSRDEHRCSIPQTS